MKRAPKRTPKDNLRPPWKQGQSGNPRGKPKGLKNFKTLFEEAAREVAEALRLGQEPDTVQIELVKRGIKEGLRGKYPFYKDLMDRLYGQAKQTIERGGDEKVEVKHEFTFGGKDGKMV